MASTKKVQKPTPVDRNDGSFSPGSNPPSDVIDGLSGFWLRFGRFGWDFVGAGLLAAALLTILGMLGITQGAFITPWVNFIYQWLGWGGFLVPLSFGLLGLLALGRRSANPPVIRLGRILSLEGAAFCLLAVLAIFGGMSLETARQGYAGGLIGWGLATLITRLIPIPWSTIVLIILLAWFLLNGLGLIARAIHWVETQAALDQPEEPAVLPVTSAPPVAREETPPPYAASPARAPRKPAVQSAPEPPVTEPGVSRDKRLPPINLLMKESTERPDQARIHETARLLEETLAEFGVPARVTGYRIGPTVTQYAVEPGFIEKTGPDGETVHQKVRVSQISALARDLALALSAERLRIEAPVPGQSFVGVEVPNSRSTIVRLRPILESDPFRKLSSPLAIALGQDVSGQPVVADLGRMPHVLIAGTTGSGKSVCIQALTTCLVMNNTPERLRIAMLDPKMVELVRFNGLPHLFGKVETQVDRMLGVLKWALMEMDARYRLLEASHARDLDSYNSKMARRGQPTLPRIVLLVDELADLMMSAPDQTEQCLVRLAQMARATGMHLVVATQRPSTDVITGLIKANFPSRISFTVASSVDSRVILDTNGAETLLGHGDMLFLNPEAGTPLRAQGVWVDDIEVEKVVNFWRKLSPPTEESQAAPWEDLIVNSEEGDSDALVKQATKIVRQTQRASASMLQRRLRIGYPRAARLIDELEELGVVGPNQGGGREREVLLPPEDDEENGEDGAGEEEA